MPRLPSSFYYGATPPFRPKLYLLVPENGDPRISLSNLKLRSRRFTLHPTKGVRTPLDSPYTGELSPDPSHLQTPGGTAETKTNTPRTPLGQDQNGSWLSTLNVSFVQKMYSKGGNVTNITHSTYSRIYVLFRPLLKIKKKK